MLGSTKVDDGYPLPIAGYWFSKWPKAIGNGFSYLAREIYKILTPPSLRRVRRSRRLDEHRSIFSYTPHSLKGHCT